MIISSNGDPVIYQQKSVNLPVKQISQYSYQCQLIYSLFIKTMKPFLIFTLILITYSQTNQCSVANCKIADQENHICLVCSDGFKLQSGACNNCITGYTLINSKCQFGVVTAAPATTTNTLNAPSSYLTNLLANAFTQNTQVQPLISTITSTPTTTTTSGSSQIFFPYYVTTPTTTSQTATGSTSTTGTTSGSTTSGSTTSTQSGNYIDVNCKTSNSQYCVECYVSFYYNSSQTKCIPVNPLCKGVTASNLCTSCYDGYTLVNGNCNVGASQISTSAGTNTISSVTTTTTINVDQNCKTILNGICSECYFGFYVEPTTNKCKLTNPRCKSVTSSNICTSCYTGYILSAGDCSINSGSTSSSSSTSQTTTTTGTTGTTTSSGNTFITYGSYYIEVTPTGQVVGIYSTQNGLPASATTPTTTTTTTTTTPATTTPTVNTDPFCLQYQSGSCVTCANRYYVTAQGCKMIDVQCKSWTSNGVCVQCYGGYAITANGCAIQVSQSSQTTQTSQTTTTTDSSSNPTCFYRQVNINGNCVKVDDQCKTWSTDAKCTSCYPGYSLNLGTCKV